MHTHYNNYNIPAIVCDAEILCQIATIQELGKYSIPLVVISTEPNAIGFYSKYATTRILTKIKSYEQEFIDYLINNIPRGVIFYSNDANVENISKHKKRLLDEGFRVLVADYDIIAKVLDKYELYLVSKKCSVKCPRSYLIKSISDLNRFSQQVDLPYIIKATTLAGGVYRIIKDESELPRLYEEMNNTINKKEYVHRQARLFIQEWIEPEDASLWNFNACVKNGDIISYSMGRRIRTDVKSDGTLGSMLLYGVTEFNQEIYEANKILFKSLNYEGIVETEWSTSPHYNGAYLYDFNPRPTGNIRWVYRSGVSIAEHYYRLNLDLPLNCNIKMKEGVKYYKIFHFNNDFLFSIQNPNLSKKDALVVLKENIVALLNYKKNAIDILDITDIRPTVKEIKEMLFHLIKKINRFLIKMFKKK